jgi:hypothetical protein
VAPVRVSTTTDNGAGLPRADLHIALLARTEEQGERLTKDIHVVTPPLWKGEVHLHVIVSPDMTTDELKIAQVVADLGWGVMVDIAPPTSITRGYPAGDEK